MVTVFNHHIFWTWRQARDVVKAIKKRLGSKHPDAQLYAVTVSIMNLLRLFLFKKIRVNRSNLYYFYWKTYVKTQIGTPWFCCNWYRETWLLDLFLLSCCWSVDPLVAGDVDEQYWRAYSWAGDWYRNYSYSCENCEEKGELSPLRLVVLLG